MDIVEPSVCYVRVFFLMIRRPPRSTLDRSSAASDVYKRQDVCDIAFQDRDEDVTSSPAFHAYAKRIKDGIYGLSLIHISEPTRPY